MTASRHLRMGVRVIAVLRSRPGQVVPHADLLRLVWGKEWTDEEMNRAALRVAVSRARRLLEVGEFIVLHKNVGYALADSPPSPPRRPSGYARAVASSRRGA